MMLWLPVVKWPQVLKIQHHNCHDSSELDHHHKHFPELFTHIQLYKFLHQDQMARAADGEPFCNALHNSKKNNLQ